MTSSHHPSGFSHIHRDASAYLEERGHSQAEIDALLQMDMANFRWRRLAEKGEFIHRLTLLIGANLEPAMLQGLLAAAQIASGLGGIPQPPTIGAIAERMSVDPSRASRIVSELVSRGYLTRELDQSDARRTNLVLTAKTKEFLRAFSQEKWKLIADIYESWTPEEIRTFSSLFVRYVDQIEEVLTSPVPKDEPE